MLFVGAKVAFIEAAIAAKNNHLDFVVFQKLVYLYIVVFKGDLSCPLQRKEAQLLRSEGYVLLISALFDFSLWMTFSIIFRFFKFSRKRAAILSHFSSFILSIN